MVSGFNVGVAVAVGVAVGGLVAVGKAVRVAVAGATVGIWATSATGAGGLLQAVTANNIATNPK